MVIDFPYYLKYDKSQDSKSVFSACPQVPILELGSEKSPICLSSAKVDKCDFEMCTGALVGMKRIGHSIFVIYVYMYICSKYYLLLTDIVFWCTFPSWDCHVFSLF